MVEKGWKRFERELEYNGRSRIRKVIEEARKKV